MTDQRGAEDGRKRTPQGPGKCRGAKALVIVAVAAGAMTGVLAKLVTAGSLAIGFYRLTMSVPVIVLFVLKYHRQELLRLDQRAWRGCFLAGLFYFLQMAFWFRAVKTTPIASAVILQSLHPLAVLFVTVLIWKKRLRWEAAAGVAVVMAGGALTAGLDYSLASGDLTGHVLALLSGIFLGLYFCMGTSMRERMGAATYLLLIYLFGWIFFTLSMFLTNTPFTGYPAGDYFWIFLMTLLGQFATHGLFNWSLGYVSALYVSACQNLEIIFAGLWAFLLVREIPASWQFAGAAFVLCGLFVYNYFEAKTPAKKRGG